VGEQDPPCCPLLGLGLSTPQRLLLWYRNDLRIHDHEPLVQALETGAQVIPVYCFDPRQFGKTAFGFPKTGVFRAQFLLESVADLRKNLRVLGSDLVIRVGQPENVLPELATQVGAQGVAYHREVTDEETRVEQALTTALKALSIATHSFWGHTLYGLEDLPFKVAEVPEIFSYFRKDVEAKSSVYECWETPSELMALPEDLDVGEMPALADWGLEAVKVDERSVLAFQGGETAGLDRVKTYIWKQDRLRVYKETRDGMKGADYSSKFSPWLALGCLSPRYLYQEVQNYEDKRIRNDSTYWLVFELLWRDYFRFICAKHGTKVFKIEGLQGVRLRWSQDPELFQAWCEGKTGYPLVDANMRELKATGFMSNRGRQNVASFLTKNLGIDWRMGAEWFESLLIDYDPCSNWGNWNYTAGVGNDSRGFRFFNITKQAKDYDPDGEYVKYWLPELAKVNVPKIYEPWKLSAIEQERFGVKLGTHYPDAIVDLFLSAQKQEGIYNAGLPTKKRR
jgi:deoxyribodipyrimidine photo-lyase